MTAVWPVRWSWLAWAALGAAALLLRARGLHGGLIYPDGYDYLLMARGIGAHLTPTVQLGHGGELFVPSVDAALKPLFPALVAAFSGLAGAQAAAQTLTALAGAATVVLAGLVSLRLTGSRLAAAVAAGSALVSPAIAYWSGFVGPDPMAGALALAAALALLSGRAQLTGILGALCAATRPEWLLAFLALALAGLLSHDVRDLARRALITGAFTLAAVLALLRPPLAAPAGGLALILGAVAAGTALQLGARWAAGGRARATLTASTLLSLTLAFGLSGRGQALSGLLSNQWPLLLLAAIGILTACWGDHTQAALALLGTGLLLGAIYTYRNAGSERYLAEVLPLACVAAGFAAAPRRWPPMPASFSGALLVLSPLVASPMPPLAPDTFATLAPQLAKAPAGALISAAPDAYGFLLPGRPQRSLRPGARGLILLDGAQRAYAPGLDARGALIAKLTAPQGFQRPDGTIDTAPALLIRGVVTEAR
jgi:hypothetical protein